MGVAIAVVAMAAGYLMSHRTGEATAEPPRRFVIQTEGDVRNALISPDGRRIAYITGNSTFYVLWLPDRDRDQPRRIEGPGRFRLMAWSPDSPELAYADGSMVYRMPATGAQ